MSLESELRQTSDSLLRALERMNDMETEKRLLPIGSVEFVKLAQQIEDLALEVLRRSEREASLAEDTAERREAGGGVSRPIEAVPPQIRELALILTEWRDAERRLANSSAGSVDSAEAAAAVRRLRAEYRMAHEARDHQHRRDDHSS